MLVKREGPKKMKISDALESITPTSELLSPARSFGGTVFRRLQPVRMDKEVATSWILLTNTQLMYREC